MTFVLEEAVGDESEMVCELAQSAKELFEKSFDAAKEGELKAAVAPGRVNLIGEHVDYTGGWVLPFAIHFSTVVYGRGRVVQDSSGNNGSKAQCRIVSTHYPHVVEFTLDKSDLKPLEDKPKWANYVAGCVAQYLKDMSGTVLELEFAVCGNVPLGSGLSSSASLEVAVAIFVECFVLPPNTPTSKERAIVRALKCQKSEHDFCNTPCGIMDQYVSSAALPGSLLLIDCLTNDYEPVVMAAPSSPENAVKMVVINSMVSHDNAGGEYPVRVRQCQVAEDALKGIGKTLRTATLEDLQTITLDDLTMRRAKHAVSENARTREARRILELGDWTRLGQLMNGSHESMRDDYEVSCEEIDFLVKVAQSFDGVYGSRLTGGGFGGCTVTLCQEKHVEALMDHIKKEYKAAYNIECECFETVPGKGARELK
mmetsp:Transcript_22411/g.40431  ORF Transcript_22411/g.40431 Transcript_22411/m.40431 type:complete len:426 (-) Transcript_22411:122-1399(-)